MRTIILPVMGILIGAVAGCVSPSPPTTPPEPVVPISQTSGVVSSAEINRVFSQCLKIADYECRSDTVYCRSYRRAYVQGCLVQGNVPADMIFTLMH